MAMEIYHEKDCRILICRPVMLGCSARCLGGSISLSQVLAIGGCNKPSFYFLLAWRGKISRVVKRF